VPDLDLTPIAAPDYRGRRRAMPPAGSAEPAAAPELIEAAPEPPPLTRRELLALRREAERLATERLAVEQAVQQAAQGTPSETETKLEIETKVETEVETEVEVEVEVETGTEVETGAVAEPEVEAARALPTRRQLTDQRHHDDRRAGFGPSKAAVALGAASVALVAVVAGRAFGPTAQASAAAELSVTATTTANQASPRVDPTVAAVALQTGDSKRLPSGLAAASRSELRPVLPGCSGKVTDFSYRNGEMPTAELCTLNFAPKHHLRADAAVALARLNIAYRARFGHDICLTDSYRSLASQESLAARKPGLAARPGTSEHGMGLAVDLCDGVEDFGSTQYKWMRATAPTFGWQNPAWAIPPSSREEPWHWEYVVGERKGQSHADS
jgi:D-alanyl-D-alanine carboxypeptidase